MVIFFGTVIVVKEEQWLNIPILISVKLSGRFTFFNDIHWSNTKEPYDFTFDGIVISVREWQPENAWLSISAMFSGRAMLFRAVHPFNAFEPIFVILIGSSICVNEEQAIKAKSSIVLTPSERITFFNETQLLKVHSFTDKTFFGMIICSSDVQDENAFDPSVFRLEGR